MNTNSIDNKAIDGAMWKFLERILAQLVSLVISVVLARILQPEDYSVVGIVAIFFAIANVLITGGFNSALIQKRNSDHKDYSSVLWVSLCFSLISYVVLFFCAPAIADLYKQPVLKMMIRVMGIILPINAVKAIWCAYISSKLQFRKFFFSTIGSVSISAIVGLIMAVNGFGAWSLVAQQMVDAIAGTMILMISTRIRIEIKVYWDRIKGLFDYGWKVFVSSVIGKIYTELNPLVIGLKFQTADLSYYTKGNSFPAMLSTTTTSTFSAVLLPVLSKYQDDKTALLNRTRWFIRISSFLAFPAMLGLFAVADNFVKVVLTDKWLPIVPFIRVFCISHMFEMIHSGNCEAVKALGRSDVFLKMEIIKKTLYFVTIGLFVWLADTPLGLAYSMIVCTVIAIIVNAVPNRWLLGYKFSAQAFDLLPNLTISTVMCLVVLFIGRLPINCFALLPLQMVIGVAVYCIAGLVSKNKGMYFILDYFKRKIGKGIKK